MEVPPATPIRLLAKHLLDVEQYCSPIPKRARSLHFREEQSILTLPGPSPLPASTPGLTFDTHLQRLGSDTARSRPFKRTWECTSPGPLHPLLTLTPSPGVKNAQLVSQAVAKRHRTLRACLQAVATEGLVGPSSSCSVTPVPQRSRSAAASWLEVACESVFVTPLLQRPAQSSGAAGGSELLTNMEVDLDAQVAAPQEAHLLCTPLSLPTPPAPSHPFAGSFLYREFIRSSPHLNGK